ncbi:MAG: DUF2203 domain-containing protein [Bacteriovoracia bacterium]
MATTSTSKDVKIFSLSEARSLLPDLQKVTQKANDRVSELVMSLDAMVPEDPDFHETRKEIDRTVKSWAKKVETHGCLVKGIWLVDFDNGHGYYCWNYPEEEVDHFHGYDEGFSKRIRIC